MHRIGGGSVENLRLKARETTLNPPGISLLRAPAPEEAARQMREAFPAAEGLHEAAQVIGSTTVEKIRQAGFDVLPNPTKTLPNHYRLSILMASRAFMTSTSLGSQRYSQRRQDTPYDF